MAVGNKRRNSEKRKEKSRDAARCRRGKESEIFSELADQLPLHTSIVEQLDKASVMRLLLSHLKLRAIMEKKTKMEPETEPDLDRLYPKSLEGFLFILSQEGDIIYMSETVAKYLGLQQIDLMGQSVYEFVHPCDHDEVQEMLNPHHKEEASGAEATVFIRFKCTLTNKGRNVNLKSASYKVIKVTGKYVADSIGLDASDIRDEPSDVEMMDSDEEAEDIPKPYKPLSMPHLIAVGETIPHPSNIEIPLDRRTFTSRHSMNMKFTDCDERIDRLIGYHHETMIGQSFFAFHHAMDSKMMEKTFKDLFSKGQAMTGQYRFLAKNGGYVWMVTQATVIFSNKTQRPQCVVCVHYVLSHVEQHGRVLSMVQLPSGAVVKEEPTPKLACRLPAPSKVANSKRLCMESLFHVPTFSTEDVFKEKTDDMDGYPGLKKTDRKKDVKLSHLVPHDREVVPRQSHSHNLLKEVESFGTSLNLYDDFADIDSSEFRSNIELMVPDDKQPMSGTSSGVTSPFSVSNAASGPASPADYLATINPMDITSTETLMSHLNPSAENSEDIDFLTRAPFVPMTSDEDFILCQPGEALQNMGCDLNPGVFGCTESVFKLKDELYEGPAPEKKKKPIDVMDRTTVKASIEQPHDTMIMQMKRQLDRSCLEKGPPVKKTKKYQLSTCLDSWPKEATEDQGSNSSSVLKNLLLNGVDKDNGYRVQTHNISSPSQDSLFSLQRRANFIERQSMGRRGLTLNGCDLTLSM